MSFLIPLVCLLPGGVGMSYHAPDPVWGLGFSETQLAPDVWRRIRFCPCYNRRRSSRATGLFLTSISLVGGIVERAKLPESRGSKSNGASWPFQVAESMGFRANFANGSTY
jgi:hypothetical protein